jgi:hypothetical protein
MSRAILQLLTLLSHSCYCSSQEADHLMPDYGATDRVRRFVQQEVIEPARRRGERTVTIHAGTLGKLLQERNILPSNRFPIICGAVGLPEFAKRNRISLQSRRGPKLSSTTTFVFTLEPPVGDPGDAATESLEGTGISGAPDDSFLSLRGILKATYRQLGGAETFHGRERESWDR